MNTNRYGLSPTSDLSTTENAVALFHWWNDLSMKRTAHFLQYKEWLPSFYGEIVIFFGGRYTADELWGVWNEVDTLINGEVEEIDYDSLTDEQREIAEDCANFIFERMTEREKERDILAKYETDLFG